MYEHVFELLIQDEIADGLDYDAALERVLRMLELNPNLIEQYEF